MPGDPRPKAKGGKGGRSNIKTSPDFPATDVRYKATQCESGSTCVSRKCARDGKGDSCRKHYCPRSKIKIKWTFLVREEQTRKMATKAGTQSDNNPTSICAKCELGLVGNAEHDTHRAEHAKRAREGQENWTMTELEMKAQAERGGPMWPPHDASRMDDYKIYAASSSREAGHSGKGGKGLAKGGVNKHAKSDQVGDREKVNVKGKSKASGLTFSNRNRGQKLVAKRKREQNTGTNRDIQIGSSTSEKYYWRQLFRQARVHRSYSREMRSYVQNLDYHQLHSTITRCNIFII